MNYLASTEKDAGRMLKRLREVRELYTKRASEYDEHVKKLYRRWFIKDVRYRRRLIEKLDLKEEDTVLDIGCGTGWNFEYLQRKIGEKGCVIGLDLTPAMLRKAKERVKRNGWENIELIQGDALRLPLRRKFDAVLSTYVMSLVSPYEKGLSEAVRVLVEGGRMGILDVQPFRGLFRIFNPILASQVRSYVPDLSEYTYKNAGRCIRTLKKLLGNVELEEYYLGMIYLASGVKTTHV